MLKASFLAVLLFQVVIHYPIGSVVRLTATPDSGWRFVEWEQDIGGPVTGNPIDVGSTMNLTPVFEQENGETFTVTLSEGAGGVVGYEMLSLAGCGDGDVAPLWESCDDGNLAGGDGCSPVCELEPSAPPPPPDPAALTVINQGTVGQSGSTSYRLVAAQPVEAGATLVVLINTAPADVAVLSVSDGVDYVKTVEAISDDATQWSPGRACIYYRVVAAGAAAEITVVTSKAGHLSMTLVELRGGALTVGSSSVAFATGTPDPGSITTTKPAVIVSTVQTTGGLPAVGVGNTLLYSGQSAWYVGRQYRIEATPGTFTTDFVGSGQWVAAAVAFEANQ